MRWLGILLIIVGTSVLVWFTVHTKTDVAFYRADRHLSTTQERYQIIGGNHSCIVGLIVISILDWP